MRIAALHIYNYIYTLTVYHISCIYPSKIEHQNHSTKFCRPIFPTYHGLAGTLYKSLPQSESTTSLKSFCLCHFGKNAPQIMACFDLLSFKGKKGDSQGTSIYSNFKKGTSFVLVAKARSDSHTSLGSLPWGQSYHQQVGEVLNS